MCSLREVCMVISCSSLLLVSYSRRDGLWRAGGVTDRVRVRSMGVGRGCPGGVVSMGGQLWYVAC